MKHNAIFLLLALSAPLFLSACSGVNIPGAKPAEAVSIVQMDTYINNHMAMRIGSDCFPEFTLVEQHKQLNYDSAIGSGFIVLQTPPGTIRLTALHCIENEFLYNKERIHTFTDGISFHADAGHVNYAGKVKVNYWTPDANIADALGEGQTESDDNRVQMKLQDDYKGAQKLFIDKYKQLPPDFTFKKSLFGKNELFD